MSRAVEGVPDSIIELAMLALAIALLLTFVRLVRGPSLMDRVVALELIASLVAGIVAVYAIATDVPALLDVAIALALVAFLAAVAFARYAERALRP
ncbi:MAG: monovalent cation/H+ antiporter complex subunit F [Candidatus Limnocylindrales bacterium]|jgi:multicomponent Na+:H+ antiporter subunit F